LDALLERSDKAALAGAALRLIIALPMNPPLA
jgi:hypothetical protein